MKLLRNEIVKSTCVPGRHWMNVVPPLMPLQLPGRASPLHVRLHFRSLQFRDRALLAIILEDINEEVRLERERDRLLAAPAWAG